MSERGLKIAREWRWLSWHKGGDVSGRDGEGAVDSFYAGFDLTAINRPHLTLDWWDNDCYGITLDWGNGNSDPVWSLSIGIRPSRLPFCRGGDQGEC